MKDLAKGNPTDPLLTIQELCSLLKLAPPSIYQLTYRGEIPHYKIANRLRFRQSEITEWIEKHKVVTTPENEFTPRI